VCPTRFARALVDRYLMRLWAMSRHKQFSYVSRYARRHKKVVSERLIRMPSLTIPGETDDGNCTLTALLTGR
jgi:hypothetical protein